MKINVQKDENSKIYRVEIPSTVDLTHLSKGELFPVNIMDDKGLSHLVEVCLLADGRSFLLGNNVIRFHTSMIGKKNEVFRLGIQNDGLITQNHVIANIIRSVKPRVSSLNLSGGEIKSPMTGKIISLLVKNNSKIKEGDTLLIIEAMKMENRILAECDGIISNIKINPGLSVTAGDLLLSIIPLKQG